MSAERPEENVEKNKQQEATELTAEAAAELINALDAPLSGRYVEIGPALNPYIGRRLGSSLDTSRRKFDQPGAEYIGIDGGTSEYERPRAIGWGAVHADEEGREAFSHPGQSAHELELEELRQEMLEDLHDDGQKNVALVTADARRTNFEPNSVAEVFASDVFITPGTTEQSMLEMATETRKALKPDGLFVIRENYMPQGNPTGKLVSTLRQAGFAEVFVHNASRGELEKAINRNFGFHRQVTFIARGRMAEENE